MALSSNKLLQPPLELAPSPLDVDLGEVAEYLHDGDDQGLQNFMGRLVVIFLKDATNKMVKLTTTR
jgi:hypothetical protein